MIDSDFSDFKTMLQCYSMFDVCWIASSSSHFSIVHLCMTVLQEVTASEQGIMWGGNAEEIRKRKADKK